MEEALAKAIKLIKEFEGCRLKVYIDPAGRLTVGYGTTQASILGLSNNTMYPPLVIGASWSQAQCDQALTETMVNIYNQVSQVLGQPLLSNLNSNQLAAVVDFVYNLGIGSFLHSGLLRGIRAGNTQTSASNILLWNKIGPYVSPGLTRRRQAEYDLFVAPVIDPTDTAHKP